MPFHGELSVQFRVHNDSGADVVMSHQQAIKLHEQLTTALQEIDRVPKPAAVKQPAVKRG